MSCSKLPAGSYLTLARLSDLHLHKLSFPPVSSLIEFATESKFKLAEKSRFTTRYRCSWRQPRMFFLIFNCIWIKGFAPDDQLVVEVLQLYTFMSSHCFIWTLFFKVLPTALIWIYSQHEFTFCTRRYWESRFRIWIYFKVKLFWLGSGNPLPNFNNLSCMMSKHHWDVFRAGLVSKYNISWHFLSRKHHSSEGISQMVCSCLFSCPTCDKPAFCLSNWKLTTAGNSSNKVITG